MTLCPKRVSSAVLLIWIAFSAVFLALGYSLIVGDSRILSANIVTIHLIDWILLVGLALCGILGFLCVTLSLRLISPSLMISIRTLELVLSALVTSIIQSQVLSLLSSIGVCLITFGVLLLACQKQVQEKIVRVFGKQGYQPLP